MDTLRVWQISVQNEILIQLFVFSKNEKLNPKNGQNFSQSEISEIHKVATRQLVHKWIFLGLQVKNFKHFLWWIYSCIFVRSYFDISRKSSEFYWCRQGEEYYWMKSCGLYRTDLPSWSDNLPGVCQLLVENQHFLRWT